MTPGRRVRVVSLCPIEGGERGGHPVEVAADDGSCGVSEGQVDEENAVGALIEALRYGEDALRAVGSRIDNCLVAVDFLPCQVVNANAGLKSSGVIISTVDHHD